MYNLLKINMRLALRINTVRLIKVSGQCVLNKFVQRIQVEMFICCQKKNSSADSPNYTDPASC